MEIGSQMKKVSGTLLRGTVAVPSGALKTVSADVMLSLRSFCRRTPKVLCAVSPCRMEIGSQMKKVSGTLLQRDGCSAFWRVENGVGGCYAITSRSLSRTPKVWCAGSPCRMEIGSQVKKVSGTLLQRDGCSAFWCVENGVGGCYVITSQFLPSHSKSAVHRCPCRMEIGSQVKKVSGTLLQRDVKILRKPIPLNCRS
jgi:hypothetical protein